ncbi:MAG: alpha/beta hydrolase family protein [Gammaproteobacteria bacterium]|jgi:dienelactone hydrolase|nr:alpha/beta hydrolase family protein [Gammaproteobacteria bacterium]
MKRSLIFLLFMLFALPGAWASDLAKEKRWADQVMENLFDGEAVWLQAGELKFLGLLTEAAEPKGAVVVMHGVGIHPDWQTIVNPLRVRLAAAGWTTLSIQMPILANEAELPEYQAIIPEADVRIVSALSFLKAKGFPRVTLIAHSLGTTMANHYLAGGERPDVISYVAIGMGVRGGVHSNDTLLPKIRVPLLDLYGGEDLQEVVGSADIRATAARGNPGYVQQRVPGADHFFEGEEDDLLTAVRAWLEGHPQ